MDNWMLAINAHIHHVYLQNRAAGGEDTSDFWDDGDIKTTFWKVCQASLGWLAAAFP